MKRTVILLAAACIAGTAFAQTMNIRTGSVTTAVAAAQAGDMTYANNGTELTVMGKTFNVSDIDKIYVDDSTIEDNTVSISYNGAAAEVVVAGNIASHLTTTVDGAYVTIVQDADVADEITYTLSGASSDGAFTMDGELKATVVLDGVSLTSNRGAAIDIENGKRIAIVVNDGTTNTFADYATGAQKSCFFVNGHAEFTGEGTINLTGNAKHAYRSDEYTQLKKSFAGTINVLASAGDGLHVEQYLEMNGGTLNVSNVAADAIDVAATNDLTDEFNGQMFINGGTIIATAEGGDVKVLKADADIAITDGALTLTATGAGSKAISTKGALSISGGKVEALSLGGVYNDGLADEAKPNSIKATGIITISGGEVYSVATNKAFNTDVTSNGFVINGGTVMGIGGKASAHATGSQTIRTTSGYKVTAGATVTYGGVSYTLPESYTRTSIYIVASTNN